MTQFAHIFTLTLQKIKINTLYCEEGTGELNREFNSQTKQNKIKQQNQNRFVKPNLSYTDILHDILFKSILII